jgi:AraC family transcriptional regulator of arabinose operon
MAQSIQNPYQIHLYRSALSVEFGEVTYRKGGTLGPRFQSSYQIVVLLAGSLKLSVDGLSIDVPPHHAVLLSPGHEEYFAFSRETESRHSWVSADPQRETFPVEWAGRCPMGPVPASSRLNALLQIGLERGNAAHVAPVEVLRCLGRACFFEVASDADPMEDKPSRTSPALARAQAFIGNRLAEVTSLDEIASAAAVTPQHLIKLFKRHLRETPMNFLWNLRTDEGVKLLQQTGLNISEIADRTGFQSPYHFSKRVRSRYGFSPRTLRQRVWKTTSND